MQENGIEAKFAPHPCPRWALDWSNLPPAVNPGEGRDFLFLTLFLLFVIHLQKDFL